MTKDIETTSVRKNAFYICTALFISAFIIRFIIAHGQIIAPDGVFYIKIAKDIASGNLQGISEYGFFNLYPFLIALFQTIFGDWEFSGKMVSIIFGSLTIIPLYLLVGGLFNKSVAIVSSLLYVVHPRFVEYSADVLREPVFWFFSLAALWLAWEGIAHKKIFPFVLASLATGFAMFTRVEGALVVVIVVLWILWFILNDKKNKKSGLIYACIFLFSLPVLASPCLILLKNKINRWEMGHAIDKIPQLLNRNEQPLESELLGQPSVKLRALLDLSARHRYVTFFMEVLFKFFKSFNVVLFLFFLYGIYKRRLVPYSKNDINVLIWFFIVFAASFLYITKTYYLSTRHGLLMVFPALAWAGIGFFEVRERMRKWLEGKRLFQRYARFDTIFLFVLILVVLVPQTVSSYRTDKVELRKAGIALKREGFSKTLFLIQPSLNRIAFYADSDIVLLPQEVDDKKITEFMDKHKGALLVIDERTIDGYAPGIRKIIGRNTFEKLILPEMNKYQEYSFSIYKIK